MYWLLNPHIPESKRKVNLVSEADVQSFWKVPPGFDTTSVTSGDETAETL